MMCFQNSPSYLGCIFMSPLCGEGGDYGGGEVTFRDLRLSVRPGAQEDGHLLGTENKRESKHYSFRQYCRVA